MNTNNRQHSATPIPREQINFSLAASSSRRQNEKIHSNNKHARWEDCVSPTAFALHARAHTQNMNKNSVDFSGLFCQNDATQPTCVECFSHLLSASSPLACTNYSHNHHVDGCAHAHHTAADFTSSRRNSAMHRFHAYRAWVYVTGINRHCRLGHIRAAPARLKCKQQKMLESR